MYCILVQELSDAVVVQLWFCTFCSLLQDLHTHKHTHTHTHTHTETDTGFFHIGVRRYASRGQQYDALYVYDRSRGSPEPFNFICTTTLGNLMDIRTTNELLSGSLIGGDDVTVDDVTISGTCPPVTLEFAPEFLPQFAGIYECLGEGLREAVMITTGMYDIIITRGMYDIIMMITTGMYDIIIIIDRISGAESQSRGFVYGMRL